MYKREVTIIEKYKQADEVRKLKEHFRKHSLVEEYKDRIKEMRAVEKVAELEVEAKIAWRFRESRNAINAHKKSIDSKIQSEILKLKVKQDLRKQAKKIVHNERPSGPKKNVLPYLHRHDEELSDSSEDSTKILEISIPKRELKFKIMNNTPSPVKGILIKNNYRNLSPEIQRVRF